jgi:glycosyltransferase involved in cell wall biosynthesis
MSFDIVIPTTGRPSLARLLAALADQSPGPRPVRVIIAEDRGPRAGAGPLAPLEHGRLPKSLSGSIEKVSSRRPGPAAARNSGWRASRAEWVVFLDDDVIPCPSWYMSLARDLDRLGGGVAGSQGRVRVPLASDRRPTDWERNVAGLERARWATADMAYRRAVLLRVGGFDERFRRPYREDSDIGLRVTSLGLRIERGERAVLHPPGGASFWTSLRLQRGNSDDALMRRLHGRRWREHAGAPRGRLPRHAASCAGAIVAGAAACVPYPRMAGMAAAVPAVGAVELAAARIVPGPRDAAEIVRMAATSLVLPFAAVWYRLLGELRWRGSRA